MPGPRLPMRKIRDVLRLSAAGMSKRKIAASLGVSATAAGECIRRARRAGLSWPLPQGLTDETLERRLFPPPTVAAKDRRPQPNWAAVHRELRRPGVTLQLLWEEHRAIHPDGYGYSRYCELYRAWEVRLSPTMRQSHIAGERLFVDYAGTTLEVVDGSTGEVMTAQLFVAALEASNYTYAEATWTQGLSDWIGSHTRTFAFIGGVPAMVVSDNLRSGITKACFYEPAVNRTYGEMAAHYDTAIVPARPYRARDKAKVEVAVQVATRFIIAKLRNRQFFSLAALNAAIAELVTQINNACRGISAQAAARCLRSWSGQPSSRCRPSPTPSPNGRNAGSGSTTTSRSRSTITRCRISCCARRFGRASRRARSKSSIAASGLPHICARPPTVSVRRCASTCRRATGAMPTGRRSVSGDRPAISDAAPQHSSRSSCGSVRTPSKASVPVSASCGSPRRMAASGSKPLVAERSRSVRGLTAQSTRS
jgi:transposase